MRSPGNAPRGTASATMRGNTRTRWGAAAATAFAALLLAAPATAREEEPPPWLNLEGGVTQPVFPFEDAIEQTVFVQSEVDSDFDGQRDLVRIFISRPGETETQGIDVPVVFEHSPYRGPFGEIQNHPVDFDTLPQEFIRPGGSGKAKRQRANAQALRLEPSGRAVTKAVPDLPGSLDNYYVPRGYAVVLGESVGSGQSGGCPTSGDQAETLGTKAVIDWLNGRARGFTETGEPVTADWTTGKVGMIGVSYNGTLPNQVATTGVRGLETIVPISAISSWYDYYRANGLVRAPHSNTQGVGDNEFQGEDLDVLSRFTGGEDRAFGKCAQVQLRIRERQDRATGDYSSFWQERDYLRRANGVRASVFVVHGLNDWNVMTKAFAEWWYRLSARNVPRKLWLHNGGHGGESQGQDPADYAVYKRTENRWFDHWLHNVPNGIMDEPRVSIEREDGAYQQYEDWPLEGARDVELHLAAPNATEPGTLATRAQHGGAKPRQGFVDRGRELDTDDVLIQSPDVVNPNRLVYLSPPLSDVAHLSGTPWVELRASVDNRYAANLTAVLVDYGPFGGTEAPVMVTRGWMDVQNRKRASRSDPIRQGKEYDFRFDLQPDDYRFPEGHRIGLVVVSTDHDYTLRPLPGTELTLDPSRSELELPIVGGRRALGL
jgi:X-Pro dipeptidyl-peptidase